MFIAPRKVSVNTGRKMSEQPKQEESHIESLDEINDVREIEIIKFGMQLKAGNFTTTTQRCLGLLKALHLYYSSGHEVKAKSGNGSQMTLGFLQKFMQIKAYIGECKPVSPGIENLLKFLERKITAES